MNTTVIIPAGGKGTRFGGDLPKQYSELAGEPIIVRTIKVFQETDEVDTIVLSVHSDYYNHMNELVEKYNLDKVKEIAIGGDERQNSVTNALHTKSVENADIVLVHDAVRPLLTTDLVSRVIEETEEFGAVIPGREPQETIKERNSSGRIIKTYDRSKLASVQTPQGFWQELILSSLTAQPWWNISATVFR